MTALRFLGSVLLVIAVIALVGDVTHYQAAGKGPLLTSLGGHWAEFSPNTLAASQRSIVRGVHPLLWDPVIKSILPIPTCLMLGAIGGLLAWGGRKRRRVQLFVN